MTPERDRTTLRIAPERSGGAAEQVRPSFTEIGTTDIAQEESQILYLNASAPGSVAAPDAPDASDAGMLEALELEALEEELDHHHAAAHGEHLRVDERLVLAPANGRFWKDSEEAVPEAGEFLLAGEVVGHVVGPDGEPVAVRSPFSGWAMGFLIPNGSPVKNSEPVLWLRTL